MWLMKHGMPHRCLTQQTALSKKKEKAVWMMMMEEGLVQVETIRGRKTGTAHSWKSSFLKVLLRAGATLGLRFKGSYINFLQQ